MAVKLEPSFWRHQQQSSHVCWYKRVTGVVPVVAAAASILSSLLFNWLYSSRDPWCWKRNERVVVLPESGCDSHKAAAWQNPIFFPTPPSGSYSPVFWGGRLVAACESSIKRCISMRTKSLLRRFDLPIDTATHRSALHSRPHKYGQRAAVSSARFNHTDQYDQAKCRLSHQDTFSQSLGVQPPLLLPSTSRAHTEGGYQKKSEKSSRAIWGKAYDSNFFIQGGQNDDRSGKKKKLARTSKLAANSLLQTVKKKISFLDKWR